MCGMFILHEAGRAPCFSLRFTHLFNRIRPAAEAFSRRLCASSIEAEDLVQNASVVAWKFFPHLRNESQFDQIFFRILRQQHISAVRSQIRHRPYQGDFPDPADLPDPAAEGIPREIDLAIDLHGALAMADERDRQMVLLSWAGFNQNELCRIFACNRSCLNMRLIRAREHIRHYWKENRCGSRWGSRTDEMAQEIDALIGWANSRLGATEKETAPGNR